MRGGVSKILVGFLDPFDGIKILETMKNRKYNTHILALLMNSTEAGKYNNVYDTPRKDAAAIHHPMIASVEIIALEFPHALNMPSFSPHIFGWAAVVFN